MGADDYIRKPFSARLLVERVKLLLRRATPQTAVPTGSKIVGHGELRLDLEKHCCTWKNVPVKVTVTEFLILRALASRPGVLKSRSALIGAAYEGDAHMDDRTIDSHVKRLRKKFKAQDTDFDMIQTVYGIAIALEKQYEFASRVNWCAECISISFRIMHASDTDLIASAKHGTMRLSVAI